MLRDAIFLATGVVLSQQLVLQHFRACNHYSKVELVLISATIVVICASRSARLLRVTCLLQCAMDRLCKSTARQDARKIASCNTRL